MRFSTPKNLLGQKLATEIYVTQAIADAQFDASQIPDATNTVKGAIRIATDAEATAATVENVAVNPKQLAGFVSKTNTGDLTITAHGVNFTLADTGFKVGGVAVIDQTGKINPNSLPDRAITDVKTVNASAEGNTTKSVIELLQSVGKTTFEEGDVVIITANTSERAEAVGGNYMFNKVVAAASITASDYVKLYTPTQATYTINNISPVGTNYTLTLADITNKSVLLEGITVTDGVLTVDGQTFNSASKTTSEINSKVNGVGSALNGKAVELTTVTKTLVAGDGVTVEGGIVTVTISGRVVAVYDADGNLILPDVTVTGNGSNITSTVKGDFGSGTVDTTWTFLVAQPIAVPTAESIG